jgi:hypothetical protein
MYSTFCPQSEAVSKKKQIIMIIELFMASPSRLPGAIIADL